MLQAHARNNSRALAAGDGYSGIIVTTSMDASLNGVTALTGMFQRAYGANAIVALGADATAGT